jgi:hypothetical protein
VKASSAKAVFKALDQRRVRYLVVGGIAVNAYGYLRFTKDIDFVIELAPENILEAFAALNTLGYHPNVPITAEQFCDPDNRRLWIEEKDMKVLQPASGNASRCPYRCAIQFRSRTRRRHLERASRHRRNSCSEIADACATKAIC